MASAPSSWFAVFWNRCRPTIGMLTRSQQPRGDRPRRHKGVDVSHPRCIMVSSRKHHRSVCGTDRTGAGIMLSEPTPPRGWRDAFGNRGGGGWGRARRRGPSAVFRVLGPSRSARGDGRHVPSIYNESRNQDTGRMPKTVLAVGPSSAEQVDFHRPSGQRRVSQHPPRARSAWWWRSPAARRWS